MQLESLWHVLGTRSSRERERKSSSVRLYVQTEHAVVEEQGSVVEVRGGEGARERVPEEGREGSEGGFAKEREGGGEVAVRGVREKERRSEEERVGQVAMAYGERMKLR